MGKEHPRISPGSRHRQIHLFKYVISFLSYCLLMRLHAHCCRHLTCALTDAEEAGATVEETAVLSASVIVAFWAAARATSPKVVKIGKKRILQSIEVAFA